MVSSPIMSSSPTFGRQHVKFGHAEHAEATPVASQEASVKTPEIAKPVTIVEIGIEPKKAAQTAAKESFAKAAGKETLAAFTKIPGQIIPIVIGIATPFVLKKYLEKFNPQQAEKTVEQKLAELEKSKHAEAIGTLKGQWAALPTLMLLTAVQEPIKEASKAAFSFPVETFKAWVGNVRFPKQN
jgi:hypothetical protein